MSGKLKTLMKEIRHTPLFRQLIPQEAGVGWPWPLRSQNKLYVYLPFFGYTQTPEKGQTALFPPFATLAVDWSNGLPVEYVNLHFRNPWSEGKWDIQAGYFPHNAIAQLTTSEYKAKRDELLTLYDELFERLAQAKPLPNELNTHIKSLLRLLMEPPLEPFYRVLAPKFCDRYLAPIQK